MNSIDDFKEKIKRLSRKEVQDFIIENLNEDITRLILKGSPFEDISIKDIAIQIESKLKIKKKLPTWFNADSVIYPPKLNLEQTSSEITANHKSKIIDKNSKVLDITGGFGVDDFYFSKRAKQVTHIELNDELSLISKYNFEILGVSNIFSVNGNGIDYLKNSTKTYDWIYIDPSRRNEGKKVIQLENSLPNIIENYKIFEEHCRQLMIKTSPMYDLNMGFKELKGIREVQIICIKNEVKEILWLIDWREFNYKNIKIYNYKTSNQFSKFEGNKNEEIQLNTEFSLPLKYLYEPNSGIMKSGLFNTLSVKYNLKKIDLNSNIFTSNEKIDEFPGKIFKFIQIIKTKDLKKKFKSSGVNLISRNYGMATLEIQKKYKLKTSGKIEYLIFTKINKTRIIIYCQRLFD
ncbi:class I SAM-dependent methyltransferase [Psychroflexus aestuariivivens]|uniref:class I SAM-dependent methyltransferase n=1 Tax=Psychroflexus aestuariivivens TaxID=1795040 RepID=UPI001F027EF2|nr:class I SAM-dependent methyltransferase [Psychroflexus aestuariivivens]